MKITFTFLFLLLIINFGRAAVDPAPPSITIAVDSLVRQYIGYIIINEQSIENDSYQASKCIVKDDTENYYFSIIYGNYDVKVKYKDSTEHIFKNINNSSKNTFHNIYMNSDNDLKIRDITAKIQSKYRLRFIKLVALLLLIKILPTSLIIRPKNASSFLLKYILPQIGYLIIYSLLIYFIGMLGMLIGFAIYALAIIIDKKTLKIILPNAKYINRISNSITVSIVLTSIIFIPLM